MARFRHCFPDSGLAKELLHPLVPPLVVTVDAVGVDPVQHFHAVTGGAGQSYYQDFFMTLLNLTVVNIGVAT